MSCLSHVTPFISVRFVLDESDASYGRVTRCKALGYLQRLVLHTLRDMILARLWCEIVLDESDASSGRVTRCKAYIGFLAMLTLFVVVVQYWWRSPLWGRGDSGSAPSGQTMAGSSSLKY